MAEITHYNTAGLSIFLLFDDDDATAIPFTASSDPRRYEITKQDIIDSELEDGIWHPSARVGDYQDQTGDEPISAAFTYTWPNITSSGGGTLNGRIGAASLTQSNYLEIIQGEEKTVTFIVEADGRFVTDVFDSISVKIMDSAGTVVSIANSAIERVCQQLDVQVFRCTLSEVQSASLLDGVAQIEVSFDSQKARLTQAVNIIKQIVTD